MTPPQSGYPSTENPALNFAEEKERHKGQPQHREHVGSLTSQIGLFF